MVTAVTQIFPTPVSFDDSRRFALRTAQNQQQERQRQDALDQDNSFVRLVRDRTNENNTPVKQAEPNPVTLTGEIRKLQPPANVVPTPRRKIPDEDNFELNRERVIPLIGADQAEDVLNADNGTIDYVQLSRLIDEAHQQNPDILRAYGANNRILNIIA